MRKLTFVLAALIFFVACYILYSSLDASMSKRRSLYEKEKKDLELLEQRIGALQDNVEKNADIIKDIKKNLYSFARRQTPPSVISTSKDEEREQKTDHGKELVAQLSGEKICSFSKAKSKAVDIQMLNLYELLNFDNPDGGVWKQGWNITYDRRTLENEQTPKLKVFVVPHSHCDPGWIKTFEKYYMEKVKNILNGMVKKLTAQPTMKFIYAEISFFERWWRDSDEGTREKVKKLLSNGQFEIVTGAWVMTDEANSHYYSTIDQLIEGNQWVFNHLGVIPKNHWSIDPFGLAPTLAHFTKLAGFSSMAVQRIHYSVKKYLAQNKQLEFYWRQLWSSDNSNDILCHVFPFYSYDVPHTCGPDPKICCQFDFRRLAGSGMSCPWHIPPTLITPANVEERASVLLDQYRKKVQLYKSEVLLVPLGDDFRYDSDDEWEHQFENYNRLFDFMNNKKEWNVEAKFGTLNDYFEALGSSSSAKRESGGGFPTLTGDFFTYADRDNHYWSGYYTSRPFYKRMDRVLQYHLRTAEILFSIACYHADKSRADGYNSGSLFPLLVGARRNLGLFQHHDGVTGTAKTDVMVDYGQKMLQSINDCRTIIADTSRFLLTKEDSSGYKSALMPTPFQFVDRMAGQDSVPEMVVLSLDKNEKNIVMFNSLAFDREEIVCVQSSAGNVDVKESETASSVAVQINPVIFKDRDHVQISSTVFEICWLARIPALSLVRYTASVKEESAADPEAKAEISTNFEHQSKFFKVKRFNKEKFRIEAESFSATFRSATGYLNAVELKLRPEIKLNLSFVKYGTTDKADKSGAYLFMPDGDATPISSANNKVVLVQGPLFTSVHVILAQVKHTIQMCHLQSIACQSLHVENLVDITLEENFEMVMRLETGVKNTDRSFYTDLNGFQIIKRKYFNKIPLQGNVYPIPSAAYIEDDAYRLSLLSGQPNGVTSIEAGFLEVFLDRRLMQDDNRGLFQPISDNVVTPNSFKLVLEPMERQNRDSEQKMGFHTLLSHLTSLSLLHPLVTMYEKESAALEFQPVRHLLHHPLPCDLHLVNLRTLQHAQAYNESSVSGVVNRNNNGAMSHVNVRAKKEQALILHRVALDCDSRSVGHSKATVVTCSNRWTNENEIQLLNLFEGLKFESVDETSLNVIHVKRTLDLNTEFAVKIDPMDIKTYKTHR